MARPTARIIREYAGGPIIGMLAPKVFVNGINIAVLGDNVEPHGMKPHNFVVIATGSPNTYANGCNVARLADMASCGHTIQGGSQNTFTN